MKPGAPGAPRTVLASENATVSTQSPARHAGRILHAADERLVMRGSLCFALTYRWTCTRREPRALRRRPPPLSMLRPQKVLTRLHIAVMPHLVNPLLLSDFFTRAIDLGSLLGMLALNGLFVLMTSHGLEYPQFYVRLYGVTSALTACSG